MTELVWGKPVVEGDMHCIKSGPYQITKQDKRYQSSRQKHWVNLGPAGSLAEAKQLCDEAEK